jgi:hypothetical protein
MNEEKVNIKSASIYFIFYTSVSLRLQLSINKQSIDLSQIEENIYRSSSIRVNFNKLNLFLRLSASEDGTLRFEIRSDADDIYESKHYYVPGKGDHRISKSWIVGVKYGQRDNIERFMRKFTLEPGELEEIDLLYHDSAVSQLTEPNYKIPVHYATDRDVLTDKNGDFTGYNGKRDNMTYGLAEVKIPKGKRKGEIPRPPWWIPFWPENPEKHVAILTLSPLSHQEYLEAFAKGLESSGSKDVLLFIHGYNESFASSVRRAAQICFDTSFQGVTTVFSWPSANAILGYVYDQIAVDWAVKHLKRVFKRFKKNNQ